MKDWLATVGKRRAKVLLRKLGMLLVLDVFNDTRNKNHKHGRCGHTSGNDITPADTRCFGKQVIEYHLNQPYSEWLLAGHHTLIPVGRIKNHNVFLCQQIITAL